MKRITFVCVLCVFYLSGFSQDFIFFKDGTMKKAVVAEITPEYVKYNDFDNPSGVLYSVYKSELLRVLFENGKEEIFTVDNKKIKEMVSRPNYLFGVKGGLNISNISGISDLPYDRNRNLSTSSVVAFHAGLVAQFNLSKGGFIQAELLYSSQGIKIEGDTGVLGYLQLPIYGGYKLQINSDWDAMIGIGPYFAYGLYGKDEAFEYAFKRFDCGGSAFLGIQYNKLQATIGYDFGVIDILDVEGWEFPRGYDESIPNICNRNLKISVGYFF